MRGRRVVGAILLVIATIVFVLALILGVSTSMRAVKRGGQVDPLEELRLSFTWPYVLMLPLFGIAAGLGYVALDLLGQ